jgi:hypothetical protein
VPPRSREQYPPVPRKPEYPARGFLLIGVVVGGFVAVHYLGGLVGGLVFAGVVVLLAIPPIRTGWREAKRRTRESART